MSNDTSRNPFVTCQWLLDRLGDESIIIADCRYDLKDHGLGLKEYREEHIPGAHYLNMEGVLAGEVKMHGGRHPVPDVSSFTHTMNSIGLDSDKTVIAYDRDGSGAARLWWLLNYFGHAKVRVLNGGFSLWKELDFPVSQAMPEKKKGNFVPGRNGYILMDSTNLKNIDRNTRIIDSRARERYEGIVEPIDKKAGHIPGAINIPYTDVIERGGLFKSSEELEKIFAEAGEDPVLYCGSGVTSCVNFIAMYSIGRNPRLYAGSWSDWISYEENEVAVGEKP